MVAFNPLDPAFLENPFPFYAFGRTASPVFHEGVGIWSVFGYNDCTAILKDNATWSSQMPRLEGAGDLPDPSMLQSDPPRHTRLRGLVSQAFTPRMVDQLEPRIRDIARGLLDEIAAKGEADLVEAFTYPLPVIVIAEILGVPPEDRDDFKRWSDAAVALLGSGINGTDRPLPEEVFGEMRRYFETMIDARRREPREDLISGLVRAEIEGEKLTFDDLLQMLTLLLVAGNETTTNLIGNTVLEFIDHPDQLQRVLDDPTLLPSAIEEVLRFSSPVQATIRRATRDVEINGKTIKAGQQAIVWLGSANRDDTVFPGAASFDVGRNPNRHIAFGLGIHFCLGAPLARLEAKVAMEELLPRLRNFRRANSEPLPRIPTFIMHGVTALPLAFDPAPARPATPEPVR